MVRIWLGCRQPGLGVGPEGSSGGQLDAGNRLLGCQVRRGSLDQGMRDQVPGEPRGRFET